MVAWTWGPERLAVRPIRYFLATASLEALVSTLPCLDSSWEYVCVWQGLIESGLLGSLSPILGQWAPIPLHALCRVCTFGKPV